MAARDAAVAVAPARRAEPEQNGPARLGSISTSRSEDGRVLIRLEGSGVLAAEPFVLEDPPRLVVDLPGTVNEVSRSRISVREGGVLGVRVAQNQPMPSPVTRLVIDLDESLPFQIVPGPGALVVAVGGSGVMPESASASLRPATPLAATGAPAGNSLLSGPTTASVASAAPPSLSGAGRPTTFAGSAAPAGVPLRETASPSVTASGNAGIATFGTVSMASDSVKYTGDPISVNLKDADLQDVFRLFKHYAGLNIVLDSQSMKGKTITLALDEVPWDQAMAMVLKTMQLGTQVEGNVLRVAPLQKLAQEENQRQQLSQARELAGDLESIARQLSYATAAAVDTIVKKHLSSRGQTSVDKRTNTIFIKDLPVRLAEIESLLGLLDRPTRQVMIEARVIETTKDFSKAVGINWGFSYIADRAFGNTTGFSFPRSGSVDYAVNTIPATFAANSGIGLSFRNILNTFALDLTIMQLESQGRARIVSAPRVMVANNERAEIESGVQFPLETTTATEIAVTYISASLKLTVTPQITADDTVIMDLKLDNNQPVFFAATPGRVSIATRQARTTVAVADGGTTVIGGIYQLNEGTSTNRVPFFSRIPILGWLFRSKQTDRTNDELLIFVTPRIQRV